MIDPLFNKYKTKFTVLDRLSITKPEAKKVAVYINFEMILKTLFVGRINNLLVAEQNENNVKLSLISNMLNLAQHYRWYFTKKGYDCSAYIYWNFPAGEYKNYKYNLDYRSYFNNKMYNSTSCLYLMKCMQDVVKMTKMISNYMNGIHIIMSDEIESSALPYVIYQDYYHHDNSVHHVMISNDKYDLQYVNYNFDIIVPRQEETIKIDKSNVYLHLKDCFGTGGDVIDISTNHLPFILSIIGCKYRSLNKLSGVGFGSAIKLIKVATDKVLITDNTTNISVLKGLIKPEFQDKFESNYRCIDVKLQYDDLLEIDKHKVLSQIIDKFDDNTLDYINDQYFQDYPILSFGSHREQIINDTKQKSIFDR